MTDRRLSGLLDGHARELVGIAYLVLQHTADAQQAAARAIAAAWRTPPDDATTMDPDELRQRLLRDTVRHAILLRGRSRSVDPDPTRRTDPVLLALEPALRVAVALRLLDELPDEAISRIVGMEADRLRQQLVALPAARAAELRTALGRALDGLPVYVDAAMVHGVPLGTITLPRRWWPLPVAAAAVAVLLLAVIGTSPAPPSTTPQSQGPDAAATGEAAAVVPRGTAATAVDPFTLAACDLPQPGAPLAYAGWLTRASLGMGDGSSGELPVYALVTSTPADGRLACTFDPADQAYAAVTVPDGWSPPIGLDGCAVSPSTEYGGYREVGGPGAFVLPAVVPSLPSVGDPDGRLLIRLAPTDEEIHAVHATLLVDGSDATVQPSVDPTTVDDATTTSSWYLWLHGVDVPDAGCWTLNVTVNGTVVGVATLPFTTRD